MQFNNNRLQLPGINPTHYDQWDDLTTRLVHIPLADHVRYAHTMARCSLQHPRHVGGVLHCRASPFSLV